MRTAFASWEPDVAEFDTNVATIARNVLPGANCYRPMEALTALVNSPALPGRCLGWCLARGSDGTPYNIAAANDGSVDRLYWLDPNSMTFTDISKVGGYAVGDTETGWQFAQYGEEVYACSGANNSIQEINVDNINSTLFADVVGTGGTNPPPARYITVVGEFLLLVPYDVLYSVQWSEFADPRGWRPLTNGSDTQIFPDGGMVTGLGGGEVGAVFQEKAVRRMVLDPQGSLVFQFQRVLEGVGNVAGRAAVALGEKLFWLNDDGFWSNAGGQARNIGRERVNEWFLGNLAPDGMSRVYGFGDQTSQRVYWAFPSSTGSGDVDILDKILVYDIQSDRFSEGDTDVDLLCQVSIPGNTIDDAVLGEMDIDTMEFSLDDPLYNANRTNFGAYAATGHILGAFNGATQEATIETALMSPASPRKATIFEVRALVDTTSLTIQTAKTQLPGGTQTWNTAQTPSTETGNVYPLVEGRFLRLRTTITAGATWTKAQGLEYQARPAGGF